MELEDQKNNFLLFKVGPHRFCSPADDVLGVVIPRNATGISSPLPLIDSSFMSGNNIDMVVDMRRQFGLDPFQDNGGLYLVLRLDSDVVCSRVDEVDDIVPASHLEHSDIHLLVFYRSFSHSVEIDEEKAKADLETFLGEGKSGINISPPDQTDKSLSEEQDNRSDTFEDDIDRLVSDKELEALLKAAPTPNIIEQEEEIEVSELHPSVMSLLDAPFPRLQVEKGIADTIKDLASTPPPLGPAPWDSPVRLSGPQNTDENKAPRRQYKLPAAAILAMLALVLLAFWQKDGLHLINTSTETDRVPEEKSAPVEPPPPPVEPEPEVMAEQEKTSTAKLPKSKKPTELLSIKAKDFTLTVERPAAADRQEPVPGTPATIVRNPETNELEITHIIAKGDTLWAIAEKYLGDPLRYVELARLSQIKDPDWIYPGDIIRITRKQTELN